MMNAYVERVLAEVKARNASMPEFIQTVEEVLTSLEPVIAQHPKYEKNAILERMTTPDRMIEFRVTWCDDQGQPHVNRGWRVQFNGVIGPYKDVAKQNVGAAFVTKSVFTLTPEAKQPFELKTTAHYSAAGAILVAAWRDVRSVYGDGLENRCVMSTGGFESLSPPMKDTLLPVGQKCVFFVPGIPLSGTCCRDALCSGGGISYHGNADHCEKPTGSKSIS